MRRAGAALRPVINGRFRRRRAPSGVDYYASDLAALIDGDEIVPSRPFTVPILADLWEQIVLPLRSIGRPLISPCNSGPFLKKRQLLVVHDVAPLVGPEWFSPLYRHKARFMTRRVLRRVAVAATVSHASARRLSTITGRDDIVVLPNVPARRRTSGPPGPLVADLLSRCVVVSISNIEPRKNLPKLLVAWEIVARELPDAALAIIGADGAAAFEAPAMPTPPPTAHLLGRLDDSDLAHLLDRCAAVVTIPLYEGFGRVLIEGLLHGAPVVASDIDAHREIVSDGVTFVDPDDADAVARALIATIGRGRETSPARIRYSSDDLALGLESALARLVA